MDTQEYVIAARQLTQDNGRFDKQFAHFQNDFGSLVKDMMLPDQLHNFLNNDQDLLMCELIKFVQDKLRNTDFLQEFQARLMSLHIKVLMTSNMKDSNKKILGRQKDLKKLNRQSTIEVMNSRKPQLEQTTKKIEICDEVLRRLRKGDDGILAFLNVTKVHSILDFEQAFIQELSQIFVNFQGRRNQFEEVHKIMIKLNIQQKLLKNMVG